MVAKNPQDAMQMVSAFLSPLNNAIADPAQA